MALERVIIGDAAQGGKACPEAAIVMSVVAFLAPVPIPFSLFRHPRLAASDLDTAFRALADVSLIAISNDAEAFTVHRVVQAIIRDRLSDPDETQNAVSLATALVTSALPSRSEDYENRQTCESLSPYALAVLPIALEIDAIAPSASLLAFNLAKYLQ